MKHQQRNFRPVLQRPVELTTKSGQSNVSLLRQPIRDGLPDLLQVIFLNEEGTSTWADENIQVFQDWWMNRRDNLGEKEGLAKIIATPEIWTLHRGRGVSRSFPFGQYLSLTCLSPDEDSSCNSFFLSSISYRKRYACVSVSIFFHSLFMVR